MKHSGVQTFINQKVSSTVASNGNIPLEKVVYPNDKIYRLSKLVDWEYLEAELGFLFKSDNAPRPRFVLGLLYLQSIENLTFAEVIEKWKKSPEWQYFCGEQYLSENFPLHDAALSIWSRVVGPQGRETMIRALGSLNADKILH